jgi:hypothetical protein
MSKIDFKDLVSNILLEAETPDWYKDVINHFRETTGATAIIDTVPPTGDLLKTLQIAIKGDVGNVSPKQISINLLSLFDLFVALSETGWGKQLRKTSTHTVESFITDLNGGYNNPETGQIINTWLDGNVHLWAEYSPITRNGNEVQRKAQGETDALGKVALQTLNNQTILGATQAIVAKRVNALEAISALRFGNFNNLIKDIFNRLPGYVSGSIKITKDFDNLVDDLYIADIYSIAAYSVFFYDSEIDRLKGVNNTTKPTPSSSASTTGTPQGINNPEGQQLASLMSSLNLTDIYNSIGLIKEESTAAVIAATLAATGLTATIINSIKKRPYDPGFMNFVENGVINYKAGSEPAITGQIKYTINEIQKIQTQEARQLIQKLQNIAQYTKKRPGAGEIAGKAIGALGALGTGMGPVN